MGYTPKGKKPFIRVEMNEDQRRVLWGLCGAVLGCQNAMQEMGKYQINPDNLPFDMKLEQDFWRAFYKLNRDRQPVDTGNEAAHVVITRDDMEAA